MVYQFDLGNTGNLTARIPVYRPKLPCVEKLVPYLREIDKNRWYSNRGTLVQAMERRIAARLGLAAALSRRVQAGRHSRPQFLLPPVQPRRSGPWR